MNIFSHTNVTGSYKKVYVDLNFLRYHLVADTETERTETPCIYHFYNYIRNIQAMVVTELLARF